MKQLVLLVALLLCFWSNGNAFNAKYPPFDVDDWKDRMLQAVPINKPREAGRFTDNDLTISWVTKMPESSTIEIRYKNNLVKKTKLPDGEWADFLGEIYYTDLNHDGLSDIVISPSWYGSGLGSFYKTVIIYFQIASGKFRQLQFLSFYFEGRDFVDLDGDGKLELLMMQLAQLECSDGRVHSFWVYAPYQIKDYNLVMDRKSFPGFPKFIQFTNKQNSMPTDKLTDRQKDEYLRTLPLAINSEAII